MECYMGCTPQPDSGEQFYVMAMLELTIYGHTVDTWIREKYPEDIEAIESSRRHGGEWGCWHSEIEPHGELGSNSVEALRPIKYEAFMQAAEQGWPHDRDYTTMAPVAAVADIRPDGTLEWRWSSLDATLGARNQG